MIQPLPSVAIVSTTVPPAPSGQARVLAHLIGIPFPNNIVLLTEHWPFPRHAGSEDRFENYREFQQLRVRLQESGWLERVSPRVNYLGGILRSAFERSREVAAAATKFKSAAIIACTGSPFDLPASTIAAFRSRLPLIAYLFDDPIFQWPPGPMRAFARLWEPIWSRVAAEVIVTNEAMEQEFFARRRLRPRIVRNPVASEAISQFDQPWPTIQGQFRIVYTGSVYHAQADAFINLLAALEQLNDWSLHIYTSQNESQLAAYGIQGRNVFYHQHVSQSEAYAQQQLADVLFLPLAFRSTIQEVLRTSAPMKVGEYLASGRPILVHAPLETFITRHFREHRAGVVVDTPDCRLLADALGGIAASAELRKSLRVNALSLAQLYKVELAREKFWNVVRTTIQ